MKRTALLIGSILVLAATAPAALAGSVVSSNWSGYVAHRSGVRFRVVTAVWREPSAKCRRGRPTYSSIWVGLGGYLPTSLAAEQIGTELDCTAAGRQRLLARYELLPAAVRTIPMTIRPGDALSSGVTVAGRRVSFRLVDRTRGETFARSFTPRLIDQSSADWIVEAPTGCLGADDCQLLPLADFGSVRISRARAETVSGRWGSVSSRLWTATRIALMPGVFQFDADGLAGASVPTALRDAGGTFDVQYEQITIGSLPSSSAAPAPRRGAISWRIGGPVS